MRRWILCAKEGSLSHTHIYYFHSISAAAALGSICFLGFRSRLQIRNESRLPPTSVSSLHTHTHTFESAYIDILSLEYNSTTTMNFRPTRIALSSFARATKLYCPPHTLLCPYHYIVLSLLLTLSALASCLCDATERGDENPKRPPHLPLQPFNARKVDAKALDAAFSLDKDSRLIELSLCLCATFQHSTSDRHI